jgi:hypothetical protein
VPTPARAIALTGADQAVYTGGAVYRGIVIRETAGAAAQVRVYDGTSAAGILLDEVAVAASAGGLAASTWYGDGGIWASTGLFVDIVSGTVEGSIRIG